MLLCQGFPGGSDGKESACNVEDPSPIPGSGRSPGEENGKPLEHSCLENPMDRGAWRAVVHGIAESDSTEHRHFCFERHCFKTFVCISPPLALFSCFQWKMICSFNYESLSPFIVLKGYMPFALHQVFRVLSVNIKYYPAFAHLRNSFHRLS